MYDQAMPGDFLAFVCDAFGITSEDLVLGGRYNNLQDLMKLPNPAGKHLEQQPPVPMRVPFLDEMGSVFKAVKKRDILLHFPYESFDYLILFYTYSHYCFASVTARISAMYAAFVAVAAACGTPALMAALTFGFFANCPISLTHYGNGCGPVYFGAGYVSQGEWWRNGFVICTMNVVIWLTIGMAWWKVIGLY